MIKKVLSYIFNPLKMVANKDIAEKIYLFCNKNKWVSYVTAFAITVFFVLWVYIIPNL
jgi:membrane protein YdbS with pleckstrin-like domain